MDQSQSTVTRLSTKRWVRDEDGCFLVLGRRSCGCSLDFGTKIVGGGRGLRRSVIACLLWPWMSQEGAQDAEVERAGNPIGLFLCARNRC